MFYNCAYHEITVWKVQVKMTYAAVKTREEKHSKESEVDNSVRPDSACRMERTVTADMSRCVTTRQDRER